MDQTHFAVAVFDDHTAAEAAVRKLVAAEFDMQSLSVVGKGFHTEETVVGFYNFGDRVRFWGTRGAFWGGLWSLFFGGLFLTVPMIGGVVVLGYFATVVLTALESAIVVGGLSAIGAALYGLGIPEDSILQYEAAVKADGFLVMARGTPDEISRARSVLATSGSTRVDVHGAPLPNAVAGIAIPQAAH